MRILDARKPDCRALVKELRPLDYIIYSHAVYQIRGDGHRTQSHLISNEPEQWLEAQEQARARRLGAGAAQRMLDDLEAQKLRERRKRANKRRSAGGYGLTIYSFLAGTGRV